MKEVADLRQQIHEDLRRQHPEWVLSNGESPVCDFYESRLMELLGLNALDAKGQCSNAGPHCQKSPGEALEKEAVGKISATKWQQGIYTRQ
jgi:hypothetical protein